MKRCQVLPMFAFVLLCMGCATDTGFYVETENIPLGREPLGGEFQVNSAEGAKSGQRSSGVERTFMLPTALDVISPRSSSALVGRWRCNVFFDSRLNCWGGYTLGHGFFCEEYEFRKDGTYSKWRVSKHNDMIMPTTEERGKWECREGGVLRIKREYGIGHVEMVIGHLAIMGDALLNHQELSWEQPYEWKLLWHSDDGFTVKYINAESNEANIVVGPFGERGRIDSDGCYRSLNAVPTEIVVTPLRFKRVELFSERKTE